MENFTFICYSYDICVLYFIVFIDIELKNDDVKIVFNQFLKHVQFTDHKSIKRYILLFNIHKKIKMTLIIYLLYISYVQYMLHITVFCVTVYHRTKFTCIYKYV